MVTSTSKKFSDYTNFKGYFIIIWGLLLFILSIVTFFRSIASAYILIIGLVCIVEGVFNVKGYLNKTYYLTYFILMALFGLISFYNILFIPLNNIFNYLVIIAYPLGLIYIISSYLDRYNGEKRPWKDEW